MIPLFCSCSDHTEFADERVPSHDAKFLNLISASLTFDAESGIPKKLSVNSVNTPWRIDGSCPWITFSQLQGSSDASITINVQQNTDPTSSRNALYMFLSCDPEYRYSKQISIMQNAPGYKVTLSSYSISAPAYASEHSITVTANATWKCQSDVNWLHLQTKDNQILISCDENISSVNTDRIGHVDVTCGNAIETITINQQPPYISSTTKNLEYDAEGGVYTLDVKSDVTWTASTSQSWINISPQGTHTGDAILYVSATPNASISERSANVYLSIGNRQLIQIPIHQKGLFLNVDKSYLFFDQQASTASIEVSSNTTWQVISKPDFIDAITPSSGNNGATKVDISISTNNNGNRSGNIVIGNPAVTGLTKSIAVSQEGCEFNVSESYITFQAYNVRNHEVNISSNTNWIVEPKSEWLHVSPTSGLGSGKINITADTNPSVKQRESKITLSTNSNFPLTELNISQTGQNFTVSSEALTYTSSGGTNNVNVSIDCKSIEVTIPTWMKMSTVNDFGSSRLSFTAPEYYGEQERNGDIKISIKNLPAGEKFERTISVVQYPPLQTIGRILFDDDINWNLGGNSNMIISVTGFGSDIDWNFK